MADKEEEREKNTEAVMFRMTSAARKKLEDEADAIGMKLATYVKAIIDGKVKRPGW